LNLTDHLIKKHHLISKQERLPFLRLARNRYATPSSTPHSDDKPVPNSFLISPDRSSPNTNQSTEQQQQSQQATLLQQAANRKYQNIVKKYRKKFLDTIQPPSSTNSATSSLSNSNTPNHSMNRSTSLSSYDHSLVHSTLPLSSHEVTPTTAATNHNLLTMNSIQSLLTNGSNNLCKQEKFKFPTLNDNFSSRNYSAIKTTGNHSIKDQQQVNYNFIYRYSMKDRTKNPEEKVIEDQILDILDRIARYESIHREVRT
jgi:hypothetical protein